MFLQSAHEIVGRLLLMLNLREKPARDKERQKQKEQHKGVGWNRR